MHRNWWENFFHGVALDFWRAAVSEEQTRFEADFIQKQLQLSAGAKVLDVPCGNGRLSIELAQRGFQLTGVDIASEFIAEGKLKSVAVGVPVDFHERDMRDLPIYTYRELSELLSLAELQTEVEFSSLDEQPFELGSQRLLLICKKRKGATK